MEVGSIMYLVIVAIWLMLPAYIPNNCAALFGGGRPLDFGRNFRNGRRILGDGKTFRGTVLGALSGIFVGMAQNAIAPAWLPKFGEGLEMISVLMALSFGAMLGDIVASFLKRRGGFERGESVFLLDQLDFVFGSWALLLLLAPSWFYSNFTLRIIVIVLIVTPILHRLTNMLGYRIKVKKEPW
jgi:CDP-2,3-bis-(O-geranylgeranyl)-sn-glycerol synthase